MSKAPILLFCRKVWKRFPVAGARVPVLRGVLFKLVRGQTLGILGHPDSGKSVLMEIVAGKLQPDRGRVLRAGAVSIPVGFRGWFDHNLSSDENVRFAASLYYADPDEVVDYTRAFAEADTRAWHRPWRQLDGPTKGLVAFASSLAMPCQTYVIEDNPLPGDPALRDRCLEALKRRSRESSIVWAARRPNVMHTIANRYAVLKKGRLVWAPDRESAVRELDNAA